MIHFLEVTKYYGNRLVFDHLSCQIPSGTVSCLMGETGSGKTTFMQLILNQVFPEGGKILFYHQELKKLKGKSLAQHRREIGWIPQSPWFLRDRNVRENLELLARIDGKPPEEIRRDREEVAEQLGLTPLLELPMDKLSMGERQLVQIARVVVRKPLVVLAEEPLQFLDPPVAEVIQQQFFQMANHSEVTVLVSSSLPKMWTHPYLNHYRIHHYQIEERE